MIKQMEGGVDITRSEMGMQARSSRSCSISVESMAEIEGRTITRPQIGQFLGHQMKEVRKEIKHHQPSVLLMASAGTRMEALGRFIYLQGTLVILSDRAALTEAFLASGNTNLTKLVGSVGDVEQYCAVFLQICREMIMECLNLKLSRLAIQTSFLFVMMVRIVESFANLTGGDLATLADLRGETKIILTIMAEHAELPFKDNTIFESGVREAFALLDVSWDSHVTSYLANVKHALAVDHLNLDSDDLLFCDDHPVSCTKCLRYVHKY